MSRMPTPPPDPRERAKVQADNVFRNIAAEGMEGREVHRLLAERNVRAILRWHKDPLADEPDSYVKDLVFRNDQVDPHGAAYNCVQGRLVL